MVNTDKKVTLFDFIWETCFSRAGFTPLFAGYLELADAVNSYFTLYLFARYLETHNEFSGI